MTFWIDGELVEDAVVPVTDHGFTVGDGVFETLRTYDGTVRALDRHLDRLARSAAGLGLGVPDRAYLERAVREVVDANGGGDLRVRLTVTAGPGPLGSPRGTGECTVVAGTTPVTPVERVTDVITVTWVRNERSPLAGLKTTSYAENVVALARARERGASEALFANTRGELCEGTGTNVFVVTAGRLVTPPLSSGCLAGVTRELVIACTDAVEDTLPYEVLFTADEVFLTSTVREVQSVRRVDDHVVAGAPGPITSAARDAFSSAISGNR